MQSLIPKTVTIGELAAQTPQVIPFLFEKGLDFCCGGKQSLQEACDAQGLDHDLFLAEVEQWIEPQDPNPMPTWNEHQIPELILFIKNKFHEGHRRDLKILLAMLDKVVAVHGDKSAVLAKLKMLCQIIAEDIERHMQKEEQILFPLILVLVNREPAPSFCINDPRGPIRVMLRDHDRMGDFLEQLIDLTDNFTPPPWACPTVKAVYALLSRFNQEVGVHVHLENNVLFPMAIRLVDDDQESED